MSEPVATITDEAVEAAARAEFAADQDPENLFAWDQTLGFVQKAYRDRARAGLAAAYPLLVEGLKADRDDLAAALITFTERRATDRAEIARLTADESKYRQLWAAQVRDRQAEPRDPAKDAAESALWETFREVVRRAEAERDAAEAQVDATRQMAIEANAALRTQLLAALGKQDDGRTPLTEYVAALIADRDTMREVAEANKRNHGILVEAYQQLEADSAKLKATIDTYLATDERGVHDAANLAHARTERDALRQHILDIDAHATPYGDIPDEPGWIGTYLVTAGALHRALGKIGHSAPKCQAEADYEMLLQAVDAQQALRRSAEEKLIATHADLAAARRKLATVAEQIAAAIEAKRGPGQSARYVAALTKAADIARQHGEVEPPESLPTGGDGIGSPDTWTRAKSSTEEQQ